MSALRRSGRWLRPPPPGRSSAHSFPARAHQIRFGVSMPGEGRRGKFSPPRRPRRLRHMCRVLGCVAHDPISLRNELLEAPNPLMQQSEHHDSGWGMAVYARGEGEDPRCLTFPEAAFRSDELAAAGELRGRIFNVHVRRATMGGLAPENTHPFCLGTYSFSHNGTLVEYPRLLEPGVADPHGSTDSEVFFNFLMRDFDPEHAVESLRRGVEMTIERTPFSGLN